MHAVPQPFAHAMMAQAQHDELSRQNFTVTLKLYMTENVYPTDELVYEKVAKPKFIREHRREPKDHHEVRKLMLREPTTQMWSSIARTLQEVLWYNVGECVERQLADLNERGSALARKPLGSLTLDPAFVAPRYVTAVDIHAMPGNYTSNASDDDVYAGAVFDRGAYYYTKGQSGPHLDSAGRGNV
ncbi:MAG: class I SAM-dependent methyltransferase, partial [Alphaproteobacteria bacterium]|nr:class I SAM-dependent methyltransferase [Alphaproteobacteria bacterium]